LAEKSRVPVHLRPRPGNYEILMTNPPFGTKGKITDRKILEEFDLSHKWVQDHGKWVRTSDLSEGIPPEVLFIERCLQFLIDEGRMAIVLPDGILENSSQGSIREFIKTKAKILAVIKLANETFIPYGTGIRASVLFLQKLSPEKLKRETQADYEIFFGIVKKIGYEGTKNGKAIYKRNERGETVLDSEGKPLLDEDVTDIIREYRAFRQGKMGESERSFSRKYSELEDRWNPEYYKPEYRQLVERLSRAKAVPLERVVNIVNERAAILNNPEAVINYVELGDVDPVSSELVSFTKMKVYEAPSRASYQIKTGDIVTAVAGNSTGTERHASAYVTEEFDGFICSNGFRVLRPKRLEDLCLDQFYLLQFLKTREFLMQMYRFRTGAAIPSVSDSDLRRVLVVVPNKSFQEKVAQTMKEFHEMRKNSIALVHKLRKMTEEAISSSSENLPPAF
jgi:type I restriction enzyme M protein